ncbi:MAG: hypothetical protein IJ228_00130 [Succinivibrio sp.]|nr:hypothetical protein [Succinivibrio sp.]
MIITKTPFRMSFFGGGTDYPAFYREHGGAVLSTTFDKYIYVIVRHLPPFFDYENQITYGKIERTRSVSEIEHPAVRNAMQYLGLSKLRVVYESDLPARSGLGSSSAFAVGMLNAFHALQGSYAGPKRLADEAIYVERELCAEDGGVQDQIAVAFGGFNRIDFSASGYTVTPLIISGNRRDELCSNLMLFFTGFARLSSEIARHQSAAIKDKQQSLLKMKELVDTAQDILTDSSRSLDDFGRLLDHTWRLKRGLTSAISTSDIDGIYERAIKAGALGGKLLGAGGGGFLVLYVPVPQQSLVREALSNLLYVPFKFEEEGSRVLYYRDEETSPLSISRPLSDPGTEITAILHRS